VLKKFESGARGQQKINAMFSDEVDCIETTPAKSPSSTKWSTEIRHDKVSHEHCSLIRELDETSAVRCFSADAQEISLMRFHRSSSKGVTDRDIRLEAAYVMRLKCSREVFARSQGA